MMTMRSTERAPKPLVDIKDSSHHLETIKKLSSACNNDEKLLLDSASSQSKSQKLKTPILTLEEFDQSQSSSLPAGSGPLSQAEAEKTQNQVNVLADSGICLEDESKDAGLPAKGTKILLIDNGSLKTPADDKNEAATSSSNTDQGKGSG